MVNKRGPEKTAGARKTRPYDFTEETIKLAYSGHPTTEQIAEWVGRGRHSVARWMKAFRQNGHRASSTRGPAAINGYPAAIA